MLIVCPQYLKAIRGLFISLNISKKKDDDIWKLAAVGLVPEDPAQFEFDENKIAEKRYLQYGGFSDYDFTDLSGTKIKEDEPLADQLKNALKKILYSTRKSAREFYNNKDNDGAEVDAARRY